MQVSNVDIWIFWTLKIWSLMMLYIPSYHLKYSTFYLSKCSWESTDNLFNHICKLLIKNESGSQQNYPFRYNDVDYNSYFSEYWDCEPTILLRFTKTWIPVSICWSVKNDLINRVFTGLSIFGCYMKNTEEKYLLERIYILSS